MKLKMLFLFLFSFLMVPGQDLHTIRKNYQKAVSDKTVCKTMLSQFENKKNEGLELAYFGAFQAIWAKHTGNPFEKLSTFKKGKNNMEKAIKQDPNELEVRLLRYSIQKESPGFLGYKSNMDEDKSILTKQLKNVEDAWLKQMIIQILKT